ncbi:uncharacterized protein LOC128202436 [Galleria mellonella]|uniref:Uncharacterized protein LOC128202436 n=1 Tax=Galleria mellonella TaxID=7137 RepID=A0ABM3N5K1_GALME|nr:uncharacterized protein LOC128202436 [Galleria mellonella]
MMTTSSNSAQTLLTVLSQHNLEQLVREPTITDRTATLLDLIITDSPMLCKAINVHHNPELSDHAMVISSFNFKVMIKRKKTITTRSLHKINEDEFLRDLRSMQWHNVIEGSSVLDVNTYQYFSNNKNSDAVFNLKEISESEVLKILNGIETQAAGFDNITAGMLRALEWFESYLKNRKQYVIIEGAHGEDLQSKMKQIDRGTPQGSIISPLLFILYTADLHKQVESCKVHLYADDTQLYFSFFANDTDKAIELINKDLDKLFKWAACNNLILNPKKSQYIVLGPRHQCDLVIKHNPNIVIDSQPVERVSIVRNLGLMMDSALRYEEHVNMKIKNAFYKLKVLYGLRDCLSEKVRVTLVETLVLSHFNYCDTVYGPRLLARTAHSVQRVQNACARFCYNIPRRTRITPILNKKGIIDLRRHLHLACLVYKVIQKKKPEYLYNKLTWMRDLHPLNTRSKSGSGLSLPIHRKSANRGSFKFSAAKIWNDLPPPLHEEMSQLCFKYRLKRVLLEKQNKGEHNYR